MKKMGRVDMKCVLRREKKEEKKKKRKSQVRSVAESKCSVDCVLLFKK
jgi:hypothetical protein